MVRYVKLVSIIIHGGGKMWTRSALKSYAKDFLRRHYWKAFLVCLIATLLSGGGSSDSNSNQDHTNYTNDFNVIEEFDTDNPVFNFATRSFQSPLFRITGGISTLIIVIFVILLITVGFAIEVGQARFFLQGFKGKVKIRTLFSTFNFEEYFPIVKTIFLKNVYNFLWYLLLIVPGIIKSYEYRFVPYILAEKPDLTANEVITRSRNITRGHKLEMFILDLSFLGWYILGALLLGIGVFFVDPYARATFARIYNVLSGHDEEDNYQEIIG